MPPAMTPTHPRVATPEGVSRLAGRTSRCVAHAAGLPSAAVRIPAWTDRRIALGLALLMGAFYLLTSGAERPWGDGDYQYQHARNVWVEHRLDLGDQPRRWLF